MGICASCPRQASTHWLATQESLKRLNQFDAPVEYLNKFSRPVGIDIDEHDRIIVTDAFGRLVVYRKGPRLPGAASLGSR